MASKNNVRKSRTAKLGNTTPIKSDALSQYNTGIETVRTRPESTLHLQQSILDIFINSFSKRLNDTSLSTSIQEVKSHLFSRDFSKAFSSNHLLEAYTMRWSPSRALAYLDLFCSLPRLSALFDNASRGAATEESLALLQLGRSSQREPDTATDKSMVQASSVTQVVIPNSTTITCFGGGAGAEILAFAGFMHCQKGEDSDVAGIDASPNIGVSDHLTLNIMDMGDWSIVVNRLYRGLTTCPALSKYVAGTKVAKCRPFVDHAQFVVNLDQKDILDVDGERLSKALRNTALITLTFTLNELYSTSISKTTNFLLSLTYLSEPGMLLLVVDSPGSYSTVRVGKSSSDASAEPERKYPMKWLLDHTLLEVSSIGSSRNAMQKPQWEKLVSDDSRWFRLPKDLKYPLDLEDMRYQYHLFKRL